MLSSIQVHSWPLPCLSSDRYQILLYRSSAERNQVLRGYISNYQCMFAPLSNRVNVTTPIHIERDFFISIGFFTSLCPVSTLLSFFPRKHHQTPFLCFPWLSSFLPSPDFISPISFDFFMQIGLNLTFVR